jgi:hypothetical protein
MNNGIFGRRSLAALVVLGAAALAPVQAVDFGDMMRPGSWFGSSDRDRDRYGGSEYYGQPYGQPFYGQDPYGQQFQQPTAMTPMASSLMASRGFRWRVVCHPTAATVHRVGPRGTGQGSSPTAARAGATASRPMACPAHSSRRRVWWKTRPSRGFGSWSGGSRNWSDGSTRGGGRSRAIIRGPSTPRCAEQVGGSVCLAPGQGPAADPPGPRRCGDCPASLCPGEQVRSPLPGRGPRAAMCVIRHPVAGRRRSSLVRARDMGAGTASTMDARFPANPARTAGQRPRPDLHQVRVGSWSW